MEDKPLLPVGVDAGVDRREWTLQHRKAADITLTPPQADIDIDMDCLDVNVKGPGNKGFTSAHLKLYFVAEYNFSFFLLNLYLGFFNYLVHLLFVRQNLS